MASIDTTIRLPSYPTLPSVSHPKVQIRTLPVAYKARVSTSHLSLKISADLETPHPSPTKAREKASITHRLAQRKIPYACASLTL